MRIYIELLDYFGSPNYLLVENLEGFSLDPQPEGWRIYASRAPAASGSRIEIIAKGLNEETAKRAMNELLSLTADSRDSGTAVIRWDGEHFTRRILYPAGS